MTKYTKRKPKKRSKSARLAPSFTAAPPSTRRYGREGERQGEGRGRGPADITKTRVVMVVVVGREEQTTAERVHKSTDFATHAHARAVREICDARVRAVGERFGETCSGRSKERVGGGGPRGLVDGPNHPVGARKRGCLLACLRVCLCMSAPTFLYPTTTSTPSPLPIYTDVAPSTTSSSLAFRARECVRIFRPFTRAPPWPFHHPGLPGESPPSRERGCRAAAA